MRDLAELHRFPVVYLDRWPPMGLLVSRHECVERRRVARGCDRVVGASRSGPGLEAGYQGILRRQGPGWPSICDTRKRHARCVSLTPATQGPHMNNHPLDPCEVRRGGAPRLGGAPRCGRARCHDRGPRMQRGQSLLEMAIACIALVPLFIGVMLLGQYTHIRQQTQAAARSAAWDATVSPNIVNNVGGLPSQGGEQDRMRALQFGKAETTLRNITAPAQLQDPMLTTFAGRPLVLASNVTLGTYSYSKSPGVLEKVLDPVSKLTKSAGLGAFPPDGSGLITSEVHDKPEHLT